MSFFLPQAAVDQHVAILGKTGSGKTSTGKLLVEHVVASGARVCVLDPIKSDWWGLISSADGRRAGLPFDILGGPRGHVPLHSASGRAIGEIVATGQLPLSIIDMADFEPGGQAKFFVDFAPALLRKMRGVVYVVIEEAHLFAPKERSGIGAENMSIHWAKTLATAGRSKGLRFIILTQRTQALHNAVLGSCDTLIAHRLTAPADQLPVLKWLQANVSPEVAKEISGSLASLQKGEAWICSGEAQLFERRQFGRIKTYDNTATPTGDGNAHEVKSAPINQDKLRSIIGEAVKEAEANDPKLLRRKIAELERALRERPAATKEVERLVETPAIRDDQIDMMRDVAASIARYCQTVVEVANGLKDGLDRVVQSRRAVPVSNQRPAVSNKPAPASRLSAPSSSPAGGLTGPQQAILDTVLMLNTRGIQASRDTVARWLAIHPNGGSYGTNLGFLRSNGYLEGFHLTELGLATARISITGLEGALAALPDEPKRKIVRTVVEHGQPLTRDELAERLGIHPNGGSYGTNLGWLRTMGIITERGPIAATEGLFR